MKNDLESLQPKEVFSHFKAIAAVPHGSGNEARLSDGIFGYLQSKGIDCRQDEARNLVAHLPASAGYEDHPPVALQGHLDMVCAVRDGSGIDMTTEPLSLFLDGDLLGARDTSLGGDDGIAVAMMLAIADDPALPHPALDLIFTTDEEVGMSGAAALDPSDCAARRMINLDSEEEGVFTVGCAGGVRVNLTLPVEREAVAGQTALLQVAGLTGGHSGIEIHQNRANACLTLGKLLADLRRLTDCRIVTLAGGTKDNVIPSAAAAKIVFPEESTEAVRAAAEAFERDFCTRFAGVEPEASVTVTLTENETVSALTADGSDRLSSLLAAAPYGVRSMCKEIPDLVQTSDNLGVISLSENTAELHFSVRSSVTAERDALAAEITALGQRYGADSVLVAPYPAWEFRPESPLQEIMREVWRRRTGKDPVICTVHAGLECGLFGEKMPGLDAVSIGPDMQDIHSTNERLSVSSVARTWDFLLETLKAL